MQLGLNKQLQPHEIKSYKHKIKNQTSKNGRNDSIAIRLAPAIRLKADIRCVLILFNHSVARQCELL